MTTCELLEVVRIGQVEARQTGTEWLIEGLWLTGATGIIGGQPKLWKSWTCLELACAVSSGVACLGRFAVKSGGPALVFMAEDDAPDVRKRVDGICRFRGIDMATLDLHLITNPRLLLDDEVDLGKLRRTIAQVRPKLLVLDPLVRIHRGNENDSRDIALLLGSLRELQREYGCAIMLAHHAGKRGHGRPGQGLRGSSDLHAFGSSNLYLSHRDGDVQIDVEHRAAAATGPYLVRLVDAGGTHLELVEPGAGASPPPQIEARILEHLEREDRPVGRDDLRRALQVNNHRLGKALALLRENGQVTATAGAFTLT